MNNINYDLEMQAVMREVPAGTPLLLHACCAPCSSASVERLGEHFAITLFYDNPCIWPEEEFERRKDAFTQLLACARPRYALSFEAAPYDDASFLAVAKGLETQPEGGARCQNCFSQRLGRAAAKASAGGFPYFATTLTISPHKNAALINQIGAALAGPGCRWLPTDLKKRDGYRRSIQLSKEYALYRQDYCGCEYSRLSAAAR